MGKKIRESDQFDDMIVELRNLLPDNSVRPVKVYHNDGWFLSAQYRIKKSDQRKLFEHMHTPYPVKITLGTIVKGELSKEEREELESSFPRECLSAKWTDRKFYHRCRELIFSHYYGSERLRMVGVANKLIDLALLHDDAVEIFKVLGGASQEGGMLDWFNLLVPGTSLRHLKPTMEDREVFDCAFSWRSVLRHRSAEDLAEFTLLLQELMTPGGLTLAAMRGMSL